MLFFDRRSPTWRLFLFGRRSYTVYFVATVLIIAALLTNIVFLPMMVNGNLGDWKDVTASLRLVIRQGGSSYLVALERRPIPTKMITSAVMYLASDAIAQTLEGGNKKLDSMRTLRFGIFGKEVDIRPQERE